MAPDQMDADTNHKRAGRALLIRIDPTNGATINFSNEGNNQIGTPQYSKQNSRFEWIQLLQQQLAGIVTELVTTGENVKNREPFSVMDVECWDEPFAHVLDVWPQEVPEAV